MVIMAVVVITEVIDGDDGGDGDNEEGMSCGTCCFAYFSPAFSVPVLGLSLLSGSVVLIWGMPSSAQCHTARGPSANSDPCVGAQVHLLLKASAISCSQLLSTVTLLCLYLLVSLPLLLRHCNGKTQGQNKQTHKINFTLGTNFFPEQLSDSHRLGPDSVLGVMAVP